MATFLAPESLPTSDEELSEYQQHNNDTQSAGYRKFLAKLAEPLHSTLRPHSSGLDYGCGPGPLLAKMMSELGHQVALYDPFFHPDASVLNERYDFITCTEVAEHFHQPAQEFAKLDQLLKPGAWLAIMTCWQTDDAKFANWHYRRDPTHVVFYKQETLQFLAKRYGWFMHTPAKDVALMQKR
ncbi:class I SAM-dependent methyltransferase [Salinibius halmophilus]|uniref:class I SAM-dependent methyltransferase n=1 Tax=Salinibius halmophilus TaxID=1853216 RepID=UPI001F30EF62|nr:class I SAM-dependent methyltransferase [Salinibius halmophilus]